MTAFEFTKKIARMTRYYGEFGLPKPDASAAFDAMDTLDSLIWEARKISQGEAPRRTFKIVVALTLASYLAGLLTGVAIYYVGGFSS
jgi:hypothetical protein